MKHKGQLRYKILRYCIYIATALTVLILGFILGYILINGVPYLTSSLFEWKYTSDNVSMMPAIVNTIMIVLLGLLFCVPIGVFSAVYLVEYANQQSRIVKLIRITSTTLSGIPSIVYGLFGYLFFLVYLGIGSYSILAGSITLALMQLPTIIKTTEEALLAVPKSYREGSYGLGASKIRTIFKIVLPSAVPGILSGVILSIGRMVGETAALMFTSGTASQVASGLFTSGRTLALHMYILANEALHTDEAFATAVVLLVVVLLINMASKFVANKLTKN